MELNENRNCQNPNEFHMKMDLKLLNGYPEVGEIYFDMTCGVCGRDSGPPESSCTEGHITCGSCLENGMTTCETEVRDETTGDAVACGEKLFEIDDSIRNTPYYKYFMEVTRYSCGLKPFGCDVILPGQEIKNHEVEDCAYRLFKYCQYNFRGCTTVFQSLEMNLEHLIKEHKLPVRACPEARFAVKYDRNEFLKTNGCDTVVPLIRGIVWTDARDKMCLLMGEDLENGQTRLWFVHANASNEKPQLVANILISSPAVNESSFDDAAKVGVEFEKEIQLDVVPDIKNMFDTLKTKEDGRNYYVDLVNGELDEKFCFKNGGHKYFGLMIKIIEIQKKEARREDVEPVPSTSKAITNQPSSSAICNGVITPTPKEAAHDIDDALIKNKGIQDHHTKLAEMEKEYDLLLATPLETMEGDEEWEHLRNQNRLERQIAKLEHKIALCMELRKYLPESDSSGDERD